MRKFALASVIAAGLVMAGTAAFALKVGDKAPEIKVAKWVKGSPVKGFEKGKVYVMEFWATWCGPCKVSIPHLTEMAKKFKDKCTFTGVSVWERGDDVEKQVTEFVETMGDKMDYNVALDDRSTVKDGWMAENWMVAAKQEGIPAAFVVDKEGKIAWIGHPMNDMDEVIAEVIEGKFDVKAHAEQQEAFSRIEELAQTGKHKEALTELDTALTKYPKAERRVGFMKFALLLQSDEAKAYPYARKLAEGPYKDNAQALNQIAWTIVDENGQIELKKPDYGAAIFVAERAVEVSKNKDPMILDTLAYAHFKNGNVDKAIEIQEKAVALLKDMPDVPEPVRQEITERLEMFKKKKQ